MSVELCMRSVELSNGSHIILMYTAKYVQYIEVIFTVNENCSPNSG